jgi:hypothetical protein
VAARGASAADRETLSTTAQERLLREHTRRAGLPVIGRLLRIDTSACSPERVAEHVLRELGVAAGTVPKDTYPVLASRQ